MAPQSDLSLHLLLSILSQSAVNIALKSRLKSIQDMG